MSRSTTASTGWLYLRRRSARSGEIVGMGSSWTSRIAAATRSSCSGSSSRISAWAGALTGEEDTRGARGRRTAPGGGAGRWRRSPAGAGRRRRRADEQPGPGLARTPDRRQVRRRGAADVRERRGHALAEGGPEVGLLLDDQDRAADALARDCRSAQLGEGLGVAGGGVAVVT